MRRFCIVIGDYFSLIPLIPKCPKKWKPTVSAQTLRRYLQYRMDLVNIKLRDSLDGTGDLVVNVNGNLIFNRADWKDWKRVNIFKAAIAMVIQNRDLNVQYKEFCPKCRAKFLKELEY